MSDAYIKLYAAAAPADSAYLLDEGSVYFYASNADKYAITGKNLIIGSTEIIMSRLLGIETDRVETAVAGAGSAVKKIPVDKFLSGLKTYSFALNTSMVLAKQVYLTGEILQKNMSALEGDEKKVRDTSGRLLHHRQPPQAGIREAAAALDQGAGRRVFRHPHLQERRGLLQVRGAGAHGGIRTSFRPRRGVPARLGHLRGEHGGDGHVHPPERAPSTSR